MGKGRGPRLCLVSFFSRRLGEDRFPRSCHRRCPGSSSAALEGGHSGVQEQSCAGVSSRCKTQGVRGDGCAGGACRPGRKGHGFSLSRVERSCHTRSDRPVFGENVGLRAGKERGGARRNVGQGPHSFSAQGLIGLFQPKGIFSRKRGRLWEGNGIGLC